MRHLTRQLRRYRLESILAPLFKMLEALFDLLVPLVVAGIIDEGIAMRDEGYVWQHVLLLAAMAVVGLVCSLTAQYFAAKAATGCATGLRHDLYSHIQTMGFSELDTAGVSTLITRMTSDINQVQNGVNMFLRLFLRSPFIVFGAVVCAFLIDRTIAWVFVAAVAALTAIVVGVMVVTRPRYRRVQERLDRVTADTRENLEGVRVIRAMGREEQEVAAFDAHHAALTREQLTVGRLSALTNPLTTLVVNLGIILILRLGAAQVDGGALLSGDVVALVSYMSQILVELVKFANLVVTLSRGLASMQRVGETLDTPDTMAFPATDPTPAGDTAVRFDHVSLTYAGAAGPSLTDISFEAKRGQTIGVIGGTGSGKTSLVHLIPRFYDATAGTVSVLGHPVQAWTKAGLRGRVGIVLQRAQLFTGTIRSNLLFGNENATEDDLWGSLRLAQAEDIVRARPDGLDAPVEQGGRNLSGGQRQRLTIARALVRRPDILILDDSASALDYATDAALRKALRTLPEGTTTFIVSQRTSSLRHADRILVLEDGRLAGQGTHEELLASCAVYREIHESQYRKGDDQP